LCRFLGGKREEGEGLRLGGNLAVDFGGNFDLDLGGNLETDFGSNLARSGFGAACACGFTCGFGAGAAGFALSIF